MRAGGRRPLAWGHRDMSRARYLGRWPSNSAHRLGRASYRAPSRVVVQLARPVTDAESMRRCDTQTAIHSAGRACRANDQSLACHRTWPRPGQSRGGRPTYLSQDTIPVDCARSAGDMAPVPVVWENSRSCAEQASCTASPPICGAFTPVGGDCVRHVSVVPRLRPRIPN
jgi:hypothetical protein